MSLTALEISFDNPVLHRNLSGSSEDDDEHEDEAFMLIASDQDAQARLNCSLRATCTSKRATLFSTNAKGSGIYPRYPEYDTLKPER